MKSTLTKLDNLVKKGEILKAFDTYFVEDVITFDEAGNKTTSKIEKRAMLEDFFNDMKGIQEITLFDSFVQGDKSYSKFKFIFEKHDGQPIQWEEVIIREWKDKLVISEFYSNQNYDDLKKELDVKPSVKAKKATQKKETVKAEKEAGVKVTTKKETKTSAKTTATKASNAKSAKKTVAKKSVK